MSTDTLSHEEQEILDSYEAGELRSDLPPSRKMFLERVAVETVKQEKEINIRISERDFDTLRRIAFETGISYQSLLSSIVHKYASGSLYDATANKAIPADARTSRG